MRFILSILCVSLCLIFAGTPSTPALAAVDFRYGTEIESFKARTGGAFLWHSRRGKLTRDGYALVRTLEDSWQHGLNPSEYHIQAIRRYMADGDNTAPGYFDQLLSEAYLRYARDLGGMRISPRDIGQRRNYWQRPPETDTLLEQVASGRDLRRIFSELQPQGPLYEALKKELINLYQNYDKLEHSFERIRLDSGRALKPGERANAVPLLRERLDVRQDTPDAYFYDQRLTDAVVKFQKTNSLQTDGIIGPQTLAALNKTPRQQLEQVIVNMERLRWLDRVKPQRYVLVNIPSATMWAVDNEIVMLESRVVVGREKRPTHSFVTEITGVRFNPKWTVPPTIKREDYLPMLREDPLALSRKGIELMSRNEEGVMQTLDPTAIDWHEVGAGELHDIRMVQGAGPTNPLGSIRVLMPNRYNIYLHDTTSPQYFQAGERAFSSGCVRVAEPERLADFILQGRGDWNDDYVQRQLASGKTRDISISNPIPVYLIYLTIWAGDDGRLVYGNDIYDQDQVLLAALRGRDGFLDVAEFQHMGGPRRNMERADLALHDQNR